MVRSLKVIGAVLSIVAGAASALTVSTPAQRALSSTGPWGTVEEIRRVPSTGVDAPVRDNLVMMPATLERTPIKTRGAGPAVLDRPAVEKKQNKEPVKEKQHTGSEEWEVRIYNDATNTREFVARCLVQVTSLSEMEAYQTMMQAHQHGLAVVGRYMYERAEMYYDALKGNGIVCDMVPVDEDR
uniref:Adaptor protein ClpS core domain-containing protein n=1 Tax=Ditylum brightwellii TaxID=49249 RepID=A0A7S4QYM2_9STRA